MLRKVAEEPIDFRVGAEHLPQFTKGGIATRTGMQDEQVKVVAADSGSESALCHGVSLLRWALFLSLCPCWAMAM